MSVDNASVNVLDVLTFTGSADISFNSSGLKVSGSFSGSFLDVFQVAVSGWFTSDGHNAYFDLTLAGNFSLGDHTFGIDAGASLEIAHTKDDPFKFNGSAHGDVYGFGVDLAGADVSMSYDSNSGDISASATVTVAGISDTVGFDIGGLSIQTDDSPPPIATESDSGVLTLYNNAGANTYVVDSTGAGTKEGENVVVHSQGRKAGFDNVTEIDGSFGNGTNTLQVGTNVGKYQHAVNPDKAFNVYVSSGSKTGDNGRTNFTSLSPYAAVKFDAGTSDTANTLSSRSPGSTLKGGSGDDAITGTSGDDLIGGAGANSFTWTPYSSSVTDATTIQGGGSDTVSIAGGPDDDTFSISAPDSQTVLVDASVGGADFPIKVQGVSALAIHAGGGRNSADVSTDGLAGTGPLTLSLDLHPFDNKVDATTVHGTLQNDTFKLSASGTDVTVKVGSLSVVDVAPASSDQLILDGKGGSDTFSIPLPAQGETDPGKLVQITFDGSGSIGASNSDTFKLSIGDAVLKPGGGTNTATFLVDSTSSVTLSSSRIRSGSGSNDLTGIQNVNLDVSASTPVTVQSTTSGSTNVTFTGAGGSVDVQSASSRLSITLSGDAVASLDSASAPVTITGVSGQDETVTLGAGLLSAITSALSITNVANVVYDDSNDTTGRDATINASTLTGGGLVAAPTLSGAKAITYKAGKGTNTLTATIGSASIALVGGPGDDTLDAWLNGSVNTGMAPVVAGANVEHVHFTDASGATESHDVLDGEVLYDGSTEILDAGQAVSDLSLQLTDGVNTLDIGAVNVATTVNLGAGDDSVTIGGVTGDSSVSRVLPSNLGNVLASLTLSASGTLDRNSLTLDDSSFASDASWSIEAGVASAKDGPAISYSRGHFSSLGYNWSFANSG